MNPAAKSVYYFGFYLYAVALTLIFVPDFFLETLKMPPTNEVWIRVVGVLAFCIGYYYHRSGAANDVQFCKRTITMRVFVCIAFTAFVLLKYVSPVLVVFGIVDLLGALWTWSALRKSRTALA